MIKHSQAHRNSTLQYKIQQSVFRAKNWRVPPYIIKFAQAQLIRSVVCYLSKRRRHLEKYSIVTVCMIVVIASAVVLNFYIPKRTKICEKLHFLSFKLGIYFWKFGKKEDILDWEQGWISDPVVGRKGPGNFSFFSYLFFKINFFQKLYQEHYQRVKQFGTRSGPTLCRSWSRV